MMINTRVNGRTTSLVGTTIEPGYAVPAGLGIEVMQPATIMPSLGEAAIEPGYAVQRSQLGLITESDAWRTGRTYGLPGTTAVQIRRGADGQYRATTLGNALGIIANEIQRSVGYGPRLLGDARARLLGDTAASASIGDLFSSPSAIVGTAAVGLGLLGMIVALAR